MLPLKDIRIIDMTNVLAGPFCGYQLARMGAEVIKIENPDGGDLARHLGADVDMAEQQMGLSFVAVNACKQSVAIDLKQARGKEIFINLVEQADVVLENFRPGVMSRLGLDYETLSKRNPRIIYCAISGFGQNGPWSDRPAYDQIIQGLSGVMSVTGYCEDTPLRAGFPVCDTIGGITAAFAISAALVQQKATGKGDFIDVSLLESTMSCLGWVVANYLNADAVPKPMGNENVTAAPSGTFRTASGPLNISANEQKQFETLCDLIESPGLKSDPRFAERQSRKINREALRALIERPLLQKNAEYWEEIMNRNGVPAGRVFGIQEILNHPQVEGRNFVETIPLENVQGEKLRVIRPGFLIDEAFPVPAPPPILGSHTSFWLQRLGMTESEIATLAGDGVIRLGNPV